MAMVVNRRAVPRESQARQWSSGEREEGLGGRRGWVQQLYFYVSVRSGLDSCLASPHTGACLLCFHNISF